MLTANNRPKISQHIRTATARMPKEKYSVSPRAEKCDRFDRMDTAENSATGIRGFKNPEYIRAVEQTIKNGRLTCICIQGIESPNEVELQDLTLKNEATMIKPSTSTQKLKGLHSRFYKLKILH